MKRPTLIVLGAILLASVGAATFMAASYQPATRSACPTALNDLAEAIDRMGKLGPSI
jgi:hypothetical protein